MDIQNVAVFLRREKVTHQGMHSGGELMNGVAWGCWLCVTDWCNMTLYSNRMLTLCGNIVGCLYKTDNVSSLALLTLP